MSRSIENEQRSSTGLCSKQQRGQATLPDLEVFTRVYVSKINKMIENLGNRERTHSCGALRQQHAGQRATLMGWCARRRDFGPLTFIDLRDRDGLTQIVVNQEKAPEAHAKAKEVRGEYVLAVIGEVVLRDEGARNPKLATGDVEVQAAEIRVLNDARTLPFQLDAPEATLAAEDLRLKYRYLDLRRSQLQANLRLRHRMI